MKTNYKPRTMTSTDNQRSFFDWGCNMQVIRKGNGEIAMTASELVRVFGGTWRKLNHRLQMIMKSSNLSPREMGAGEEEVIINGQLKGYAPIYPLSIIISLSFLLDSTEEQLFRKYVYNKLNLSVSVITPILLLGNVNN